jgi:uncharacterized protein
MIFSKLNMGAIIGLLSVAANINADPVTQYLANDFTAAYQEWSVMASQGDPIAQYNLAVMDMNIQGPLASTDQIGMWLEKSCNQNFALACVDLGLLYEIGFIINKDTHAAFELFSKASKLGNPLAQNKLANYYEEGIGVAKDWSKAEYWYLKSAQQDNLASMNSLGLYYKEKGDMPNAIEWLERASQADLSLLSEQKKNPFLPDGMTLNNLRGMGFYVDPNVDEALYSAQFNLAVIYDYGEEPYQNKSKALKWYERSARQGFSDAQSNLGYLYSSGGVRGKPDYDKAFYWYSRAAEQNNNSASYNLSFYYRAGRSVQKDPEKALHLLSDVTGEHRPAAMKLIGDMYILGELGKKKNSERAAEYYYKAATAGNVPAQLELAKLLIDPKSPLYNLEDSFHWFLKAAEAGDIDGQYNVAVSYLLGEGVNKNKEKGEEWMKKASENGNRYAAEYFEEPVGFKDDE